MKQYWKRSLDFIKNLWIRLKIRLKKVSVFKYVLIFVPLISLVVFFLVVFQLPEKQVQEILRKFTYNKTDQNLETQTPSPFPTPTPRPIPHGKTGFSVSQADKTKPQFGRGNIDPYDPSQGSKQTVTISVKDEQPITQVTAILKTDNVVSQPYPFQLISGSTTDGQWQGSWTVDDTYLYIYNLVLEATSSRGQSTVEITLR